MLVIYGARMLCVHWLLCTPRVHAHPWYLRTTGSSSRSLLAIFRCVFWHGKIGQKERTFKIRADSFNKTLHSWCAQTSYKTLTQCWFEVGPPSTTGPTSNQHWFDFLFAGNASVKYFSINITSTSNHNLYQLVLLRLKGLNCHVL